MTNPKKMVALLATDTTTNPYLNFIKKSTAAEAQYARIDELLSTGPKNTMEFRRAGIMSPAARIKEMNDRMGYYISSNPVDVYDEWGFQHRGVALYELVERPVQEVRFDG